MKETDRKRAAAKRRRRSSVQNHRAMLLITLVVCVLFAVLFVQGISMRKTILANDKAAAEVSEEISSESERTQSIENLREYMKTDEFVRQAAKDRLGLVEDGEIVFKEKE